MTGSPRGRDSNPYSPPTIQGRRRFAVYASYRLMAQRLAQDSYPTGCRFRILLGPPCLTSSSILSRWGRFCRRTSLRNPFAAYWVYNFRLVAALLARISSIKSTGVVHLIFRKQEIQLSGIVRSYSVSAWLRESCLRFSRRYYRPLCCGTASVVALLVGARGRVANV